MSLLSILTRNPTPNPSPPGEGSQASENVHNGVQSSGSPLPEGRGWGWGLTAGWLLALLLPLAASAQEASVYMFPNVSHVPAIYAGPETDAWEIPQITELNRAQWQLGLPLCPEARRRP
jgi:hypothetical protein